jgi:hypothetical protein
MKATKTKVGVSALVLATAVGASTVAMATGGGHRNIRETLTGYEEVPALSTSGIGRFKANISKDGQTVQWEMTFQNLEADVLQSHIHFENATNNGPVIVFLCTNLGNGPAGTQACPAGGGTISGTIMAANVGGGGAAQGLEAGNMAEFVKALRSGSTYVNLHTSKYPGGEIRAQIESRPGFGHGHDD